MTLWSTLFTVDIAGWAPGTRVKGLAAAEPTSYFSSAVVMTSAQDVSAPKRKFLYVSKTVSVQLPEAFWFAKAARLSSGSTKPVKLVWQLARTGIRASCEKVRPRRLAWAQLPSAATVVPRRRRSRTVTPSWDRASSRSPM
jgi:hypothetical protein